MERNGREEYHEQVINIHAEGDKSRKVRKGKGCRWKNGRKHLPLSLITETFVSRVGAVHTV